MCVNSMSCRSLEGALEAFRERDFSFPAQDGACTRQVGNSSLVASKALSKVGANRLPKRFLASFASLAAWGSVTASPVPAWIGPLFMPRSRTASRC